MADTPDGIPRLRRFILDLAVRGKLVAQDPNDEPVSELIKRIAAEKERLVKEKKIKKPKALPEFTEEKVLFEIPNSWEWLNFADIANFQAGKTPPRHNHVYWNTGDFPWVSIADIVNGKTLLKTKETVSTSASDKVFGGKPMPDGTILMSFKLSIGKICRLGMPAYHNEAIISIYPYSSEMDNYLFTFLPQMALAGKTKGAIKGATLNRESLSKIQIPLPPLAEQKRIVAKVDELMALCDELEAAQQARETQRNRLVAATHHQLNDPKANPREAATFALSTFHLHTARPQDVQALRQTILNLAVRGKLVEQDPKDEPASELLKRIAAEKERLVKEGKIKKPKALPTIEAGEEPFGIPSGWKFVRFGMLFQSFNNGLYKQSKFYTDKGVISLRMYNIQDGVINLKDARRVEVDASDLDRFSLKSGDLLINRVNSKELVGKTAIIPAFDEPLVYESMNIRAKPHLNHVASEYLNLYMRTRLAKDSIASFAKEAIGQASINQSQVSSLMTPLPPLAEQKRIVSKVDELMALCDQLEAQLTTTQTETQQLLEACLREAIAQNSETEG